jgi:poly(A) polymerase
VQAMGECGFLEPILGGFAYPGRLSSLIAIEADRGRGADPVLRLAALAVAIPEDAARLRDRLRLANAEYDRIKGAAEALIGLHGISAPPSHGGLRALLFNAGREAARDALVLAQAESGALPADAAFAAADHFLIETPEPKLPFSGADLIARGVAAGRPVGQTLRAFQALWIRADFPNEPETLARLLDEAVGEAAARGEGPA